MVSIQTRTHTCTHTYNGTERIDVMKKGPENARSGEWLVSSEIKEGQGIEGLQPNNKKIIIMW